MTAESVHLRALAGAGKGSASSVSHAPLVLFATNGEGIVTLSEGRGLAALGLKPGEAVGQSVYAMYREYPWILANVRQALAGEAVAGVWEYEGAWYEIRYEPQRDEHGQVAGVIGMAIDVSERRQAEVEHDRLLAEAQAARVEAEDARDRLGDFLDRIAERYVLLDAQWRITFMNRAAAENWHLSREELLGKCLWDLFDAAPPTFYDNLHRAAAEHTDISFEEYFPSLQQWCEIHAYPTPEGVAVFCLDITQRKRAEEALRASENRFHVYMDNSPAYAFLVDEDMRVLYCNKACRDQLLRQADVEKPADEASRPLCLHRGHGQTVLATGRPLESIENYSRPDGTPGTALVYRFPFQDATGRKLVGGIGIDVTERQRAQEALREAEAMKTAVLEATLDAVITIDQQGLVLEWNPSAAKIFGYSAEQALGRKMAELIIPPSRRDEFYMGMARYLATGESPLLRRLIEMFALRADGSEFPVEYYITPITDHGAPTFTGFARDITERKRAEESLQAKALQHAAVATLGQQALIADDLTELMQESTRLIAETLDVELCKVLELVPDGQALLLRAGVGWHEGLVGAATVSAALESQAGYTLVSSHPVIVEDLRTEARFHGPPLLFEHGVISGMSVIIAGHDRPYGVLGVHTTRARHFTAADIHFLQAVANVLAEAIQCKRAEEALRESEERYRKLNVELEHRVRRRTSQLEAANKELEAFSYSISHDLRAPLRAINGFSRILLDHYAAILDPEGQRYLNRIRVNAQQMGQLIDDLLSFSRLSRQPLRKQAVALPLLVRQVLEDLHDERKGRRVELVIGDLPVCHGDAALLRQAFLNLLDNALKYSRQCDPAVIEIGCRTGADTPVYFIKDNGAGFDMRFADKLFGVFQRLHRAEEYEGTGVGLAIVQRIVHRHGGRIWADAKVNQGATFFFTLEEGKS